MIQPASTTTSGDAAARALTLDDLRQRPQEHLRRLRETGEAARLNIDGGSQLVIQDTQAYERMRDELDRLETIKGIRKGLETMHRGDGRPMREFMEELAAKHGFSLKR